MAAARSRAGAGSTVATVVGVGLPSSGLGRSMTRCTPPAGPRGERDRWQRPRPALPGCPCPSVPEPLREIGRVMACSSRRWCATRGSRTASGTVSLTSTSGARSSVAWASPVAASHLGSGATAHGRPARRAGEQPVGGGHDPGRRLVVGQDEADAPLPRPFRRRRGSRPPPGPRTAPTSRRHARRERARSRGYASSPSARRR